MFKKVVIKNNYNGDISVPIYVNALITDTTSNARRKYLELLERDSNPSHYVMCDPVTGDDIGGWCALINEEVENTPYNAFHEIGVVLGYINNDYNRLGVNGDTKWFALTTEEHDEHLREQHERASAARAEAERNRTRQCRACGAVNDACREFPDNNRTRLCPTCFAERESRGIQNYSYKPDPIMHGEDVPHYGIELEVTSYEDDQTASAVTVRNAFNHFVRSYVKSDSSVYNGFELVTHPFSAAYLNSKEDALEGACMKLLKSNIMSGKEYSIEENGLHVHMSKNALNNAQWAKIIEFIYTNIAFSWFISDRTNPDRVRRYCSFYREQGVSFLEMVNRGYIISGERHTAINITENTIEFRFFNATLNPVKIETIIYFLQSLYVWQKQYSRYPFFDVVRHMHPLVKRMVQHYRNKGESVSSHILNTITTSPRASF